jgi:hypothetical protein
MAERTFNNERFSSCGPAVEVTVKQVKFSCAQLRTVMKTCGGVEVWLQSHLGKLPPCALWVRGWVAPMVDLNVMEKRNMSYLCPVRPPPALASRCTDWGKQNFSSRREIWTRIFRVDSGKRSYQETESGKHRNFKYSVSHKSGTVCCSTFKSELSLYTVRQQRR